MWKHEERQRIAGGLALLIAGGLLTACGAGSTSASHDPLAKLDVAIGKVNEHRAVVLSDLAQLDQAVHAADAADAAAVAGQVTEAATLVPKAVSLTALAAPIAARGRSDVISYEQALGTLKTTAAKLSPVEGITPSRAAALVEVDLAGQAEVQTSRATVQVYAAAWPDYAKLTEQEHSWLGHAQHGSYPGGGAGQAYVAERASSAGALAALDPDRGQIAAAVGSCGVSTAGMWTALSLATKALTPLPAAGLMATTSAASTPVAGS
jgi:hypothetical protein